MAMQALAILAASILAGAAAYAAAGAPFANILRSERARREAAKREAEDSAPKAPSMAARAGAAIERLLPISLPAAREAQQLLDQAGLPLTPQGWRGAKAIACSALALAFAALLSPYGPVAAAMGAAMGAMAAWAASGLWLHSRGKARGEEIDRAMPQALELLRITVGAGAVLERGFRQLSAMEQLGPLAQEFARVDFEVSRLGATRSQALEAMRGRCRSKLVGYFVSAMVQASERGASVSGVLASQARLAQREREQQLEAEANRLSTKITFPLVLFFLPAALIVALAPQVATLIEFVGQMGGAI